MTEQERQLIQGLVTRIQNAPPPQIDRDADDLIRRSITRPDALYLLVQTVLVQDMALNQAKAQIDQLKQQGQTQAAPPSGFLPNEPNPRPTHSADWGYDTHLQQSAPPPQPQPSAPSGMGGFLRSAATTAAGVIAGETAFSALSSIFGHHSSGYFGGSGFLSGAPVSPGSETIVNNYYDDDRDSGDMQNLDDQTDSGNDNDNDTDSDNIDDSNDDSSFDDNSSDDNGSVDV